MDSGPNGTLGPHVQPRVAGELNKEPDAATILLHKMAVLGASEIQQRVSRATDGIAQVLPKSCIIMFRFI